MVSFGYLRRSRWQWWADLQREWSWRPQTQVLAGVVWREMLKAREVWMGLVTQMALKGTRASEAWERQVQLWLEPQSW